MTPRSSSKRTQAPSVYRVVQADGNGAGAAIYTPYGACRDAVYNHDHEMILSGPRDTGKTVSLLWKLHLSALKYPRASIVMARKQQTDLYSTVYTSFVNRVLIPSRALPILHFRGGQDKPEWIDYPNGSRIWLTGLDKSSKVLSSEHDLVYVNQAEEALLADWEALSSTTTGRAGAIPNPQCIGDCNPSHPMHWIKQRAMSATNPDGPLTLLNSTHRDNPEIYDQVTGELTAAGASRLAPLQSLTGARRSRWLDGLWAAAEGIIYECFDPVRHTVKHFTPPNTWWRVFGMDPAGARVAALWLACDPKNLTLHVYREYCEPFGVTTPEHAQKILKLSEGEAVVRWIGGAPSENQLRTDYEGAGVPLTQPPVSAIWSQIDKVIQLLHDDALVIHDNCVGLLSEIGSYSRKYRNGQPTEEIDNDAAYHLLSALRYACSWLLGSQDETFVLRHDPYRVR